MVCTPSSTQTSMCRLSSMRKSRACGVMQSGRVPMLTAVKEIDRVDGGREVLRFSEGGGKGLNICHEIFLHHIGVGQNRWRLALLFYRIGPEGLNGSGPTNITKCTTSRSIGFSIRTAKVKVDGNAMKWAPWRSIMKSL